MDMKHVSAFLTLSALYLGMPVEEQRDSNRCAPIFVRPPHRAHPMFQTLDANKNGSTARTK